MKSKTNYIERPILTLTQSGLLAELLRYERGKVIESTRRHAHHGRGDGFFGNGLTWLLARSRSITAGRRFRRGLGKTSIPRPTWNPPAS